MSSWEPMNVTTEIKKTLTDFRSDLEEKGFKFRSVGSMLETMVNYCRSDEKRFTQFIKEAGKN